MLPGPYEENTWKSGKAYHTIHTLHCRLHNGAVSAPAFLETARVAAIMRTTGPCAYSRASIRLPGGGKPIRGSAAVVQMTAPGALAPRRSASTSTARNRRKIRPRTVSQFATSVWQLASADERRAAPCLCAMGRRGGGRGGAKSLAAGSNTSSCCSGLTDIACTPTEMRTVAAVMQGSSDLYQGPSVDHQVLLTGL